MTSRTLLTLLLVALVPSAEAYVRARTGGNLLFRTDNQNIVYLMNDQTAAGMTNADSEVLITADSDPSAALQAALNNWDAVSSADVTFAPLAPTPLANDPADGNHVFVFLDTPEIRSIVGGALAITNLSFNPVTGQMSDTDIIFNPNNTNPSSSDFVPYSTTLETGTYDIQSVATHEVGHALGSDHTLVAGASMFPTLGIGTNFASFISADDACFLTSAYPAPGSANDFGAISGTVTVDGQPATGVFVTAIDAAAGVTVGALTNLSDGTYSIPLPPGTYVVTSEALDGPVVPGNLRIPGNFTEDAQADFVGEGQTPTQFPVVAGGEDTVDIAMEAGQSPLDIEVIGFGPPEAEGFIDSLGRGPILLTPGEPIDLVMAGPGIDGNLTDNNIRLLVPGVTIRPGSVIVDQFATFSNMPIVRMTVDVTDPGRRAIGTFAITTNPTAVYTGALVVAGTQAAPAVPVIGGIVSSASFLANAPAAPGSILAVFGQNFGMTNRDFQFPSTQFVAEGISVLFDGTAAPLFGVFGATPFPQINVLAPMDLPEMGQVQVEVTNSAGTSDMFMLAMAPASTGIYRADPVGRMYAAALVAFDSDVPNRGPTRHLAIPASTAATLGIPTNCKADEVAPLADCGEPVSPGVILQIFVTGLGKATPGGNPAGDLLPAGMLAPGIPPYNTVERPEVTIGGMPARVDFSGLAPGFSGLYQINALVPLEAQAGDQVPLTIRMPSEAEGDTSNIAIAGP